MPEPLDRTPGGRPTREGGPVGREPFDWRVGDDIAPIRTLLERGGVVAIPTGSTYGLAVDPRLAAAVEAVYRIKRREARKPLPLVVADRAQAEALGLDVESDAFEFGARFWPAPLTMLVPRARGDAGERLQLGELAEVAVRIPGSRFLRDLLGLIGHGLTATSANLSGEPAITDPAEVRDLLAREAGVEAAVVVGEPLSGAAPSTIVAWRAGGPEILRQGRFTVP